MTLQQTPKQQNIFPDLPKNQKVINSDGSMNEYWMLFFDQLVNALQTNFNPEGILVPAQTAENIALLVATPQAIPDGTNTRVSNQNILYDSTNNEFKGNINGTWKTFTLT